MQCSPHKLEGKPRVEGNDQGAHTAHTDQTLSGAGSRPSAHLRRRRSSEERSNLALVRRAAKLTSPPEIQNAPLVCYIFFIFGRLCVGGGGQDSHGMSVGEEERGVEYGTPRTNQPNVTNHDRKRVLPD